MPPGYVSDKDAVSIPTSAEVVGHLMSQFDRAVEELSACHTIPAVSGYRLKM